MRSAAEKDEDTESKTEDKVPGGRQGMPDDSSTVPDSAKSTDFKTHKGTKRPHQAKNSSKHSQELMKSSTKQHKKMKLESSKDAKRRTKKKFRKNK